MNTALPIDQPAAAQRLAPANARRALMICAALAALLVLGHNRVWEPADMSPGRAPGSLTGDPAAQFADSRVGQLLFVIDHGFSCRRVLFDNRTGTHLEAGQFFCGPIGALEPPPVASTSDRLQGIRKTFQR
jgi:hypothetical protein